MHRLDLRNQGLTTLPDTVFDTAEPIEMLDLSGNDISELPDRIAELSDLKVLFCTGNRFAEYPAVLAQLPKLAMVSFKENQLSSIAEGALGESLRWLILSNNQIEALPEDFGGLAQLEKLALAGNHLTQLPSSIAACSNLSLARFSANRLADFPEELLSLPRLAWLSFDGNPFVSPHSSASELPIYQQADFDIGAVLGEGASGIIHKAHRRQDGKTVAIKFFKGAITSDGDPKDEQVNCMAAGDHPHLVTLLGQIEQPAALVFDYVPEDYTALGRPPSLETCTRDTFPPGFAPTPSYARKAIDSVLSALHHLHERDILHGDFYTHNVMSGPDGTSYLSDYGAASSMLGLKRHQVEGLKKIETLAAGYLIDDLATHCPDLDKDLLLLRDVWLSSDLEQRPVLSAPTLASPESWRF